MLINLPMTIGSFSLTLLLTFFSLAYLLVEKFPRRPVFWKRSDYVYFGVAIIAAMLGIVEQSSSGLRSDLVQHRIERNELASLLATRLLSFYEACQLRIELEERERDRRHGIIRPDDLSEFLFTEPPSEAVCSEVETALASSGAFLYGRKPPTASSMIYMETDPFDDSATDEGVLYHFPHLPEEEALYELQLAEPSEHMATVCKDIELANERLAVLRWLDPFGGLWPVLLGFAFGIRLTRVHADVRAELSR